VNWEPLYLSAQKCVDAGATWEYGKREAHDGANDEAELYYLTKQCRLKVQQNISGDIMVVKGNIAKETHL